MDNESLSTERSGEDRDLSSELNMNEDEFNSLMENLDEIHLDGLLNGSYDLIGEDVSDDELDAMLSNIDTNDLANINDDALLNGYQTTEDETLEASIQPDTNDITTPNFEFDPDLGASFGSEDLESTDSQFILPEETELGTDLNNAGNSALNEQGGEIYYEAELIDDFDNDLSFNDIDVFDDKLLEKDSLLDPLAAAETNDPLSAGLGGTPQPDEDTSKDGKTKGAPFFMRAINAAANRTGKIKQVVSPKNLKGILNKKNISKGTIVMASVIVVLVISTTIMGIGLSRQYLKLRKIQEENKVIVSQAAAPRRLSSNYVYTQNIKEFNGQDLTLRKLLLDQHSNAFYFDKYIPLDRCDITLTDDLGNFYVMDTALSHSDKDSLNALPTTIWFEGLNEGANELTLAILDTGTDQLVEFGIKLEDYKLMPAKYLDLTQMAITLSNGFSVTIESAAFSSAKSTIVYKIATEEGVEISYGGSSAITPSQYIDLNVSGRSVAPIVKKPEIITIGDNFLLAKMDFNSIPSLGNKASVTVKSLFRRHDINQTIHAKPLFLNKDENQIAIELDSETLVLERMGMFNDTYVLVYHFENNDTDTRIKGELDINMYALGPQGTKEYFESETRSGAYGGDILFTVPDSEDNDAVVNKPTIEDIYIEVNSANVNLQDAVAEIDIPVIADSKSEANYSGVESSIKDAFKLRFEAGEGKSGLKSFFDESVINDNELSSLYKNEATTMMPFYSVTVPILSELERDVYTAVVDEACLYVNESKKTHGLTRHQVTVRQMGNKYVIISDSIID